MQGEDPQINSYQEILKKYRNNMLAKISKQIQTLLANQRCIRKSLFDLIAAQLYYTYYDTPNWEKDKLYLIYQLQPLRQMREQYMKILRKYQDFIEDKDEFQQIQIHLDDYLQSAHFDRMTQIRFKQQKWQIKKYPYKQRQDQTIGILLNPQHLQDNFLIIMKNNLGQLEFKKHLKKPFKQFKQFLKKYKNIFTESNKELNKQYKQKLNSSDLLGDINKDYSNFIEKYDEIASHCKKQSFQKKFSQQGLAQNAYNDYLKDNKAHQNYFQYQKNYTHPKKYSDIKSLLQKYFQKMFKDCFYKIQINDNYQQKEKEYGFPKGSQIWFEKQKEITCKRECFQQTKLNISELKLQNENIFKKTNSHFYYSNKHCQSIDGNHLRNIKNYEVLEARFSPLFKISLSQMMLKWQNNQCEQEIKKYMKYEMCYGQLQTINEFFNFLKKIKKSPQN